MLLQFFLYAILLFIAWFILLAFRHLIARKKHSYIPAAVEQMFMALPGIPIRIPFVFHLDHNNQYDIIAEKAKGHPLVRNTFGTDMIVYANSPEVIKEVWVKKIKNFAKPKEYELFDVFGSNILTSNGEVWLSHRSLSSKAFVASNYEFVAQVANESSLLLIQKWTKKFGQDKSFQVDVCNEHNEITFDILGKAGFGTDFEVFSESTQNSVGTMMNQAVSWDLPLRAAILYLLPIFLRKKLLHIETPNLTKVHQFIDKLIETRMKENDPRNRDLLSLLVRAKQEEEEEEQEKGSLSLQEIRSNIFIFLIAGYETTSTQLAWTFYHLANKQEVQEKLYQSVKPLFENGKQPSYEDYAEGKLQYALNVVHESMRLTTPVPGFTLKAVEDDEIAGYKIPKGTLISALTNGIHTDPTLWEKPLEFIPERFEQPLKNRNGYIPFSIGPRKCLGFVFSEVESVVILAQLIYHYKFELTSADFKPANRYALTLKPASVPLIVTPRK